MENFVIIITWAHDPSDTPRVEAYPQWECADFNAAIADAVTDFCNKYGRGGFSVTIRPIEL